MDEHKIDTTRKVIYVAVDFTTGLTDLVLQARKPNGDIFTFPSGQGSFVEQGEGIYIVEYTPDTLGIWQEKVTSATNGDKVIRSYEVVSTKVKDVKDDTEAIKTETDKIADIKTETDKIQDIKNTVDQLDVDVKSGGYFA